MRNIRYDKLIVGTLDILNFISFQSSSSPVFSKYFAVLSNQKQTQHEGNGMPVTLSIHGKYDWILVNPCGRPLSQPSAIEISHSIVKLKRFCVVN